MPELRWRGWSVIGALLGAHFVAVCAIKGASRSPEDVWWLSHFSLGLAACALLVRSKRLVSVALVLILVPHALWLIDCFGLYVLGHSPMGICGYLKDADLLGWIGTAHHFYLIPLLAIVIRSERAFTLQSLPIAAGFLVLLTVLSRVGLPPESNVNYAFQVLPRVNIAPIDWANGLPAPTYLVVINAWVVITMFLPSAVVLYLLGGRQPHQASEPAPTES